MRMTGNFKKALEWYSKAANGIVEAVTDEVFKDRARCFRDELVDGKRTLVVLPYAEEKTHEVLHSDPRYAIFTNNIGVCLMELGDLESAREKFRESIEFIPDGYNYPDPFKNLEVIS